MKRILSILLALTMILSLSVCAFAAEGDAKAVSDKDKLLEAIPMSKDALVTDDKDGKIHIAELLDIPEEAKDAANELIASIIAKGYIIRSAFGIWTDDKEINFCTVKLPQIDVPEGATVFINSHAVEPDTTDDSSYYYDAPLKDITIVVIAVPRTPSDVGSYEIAPASGSGSSHVHYGSPTFKG